MFAGDAATLAGTEWALCDGTNGTPDLRQWFVPGAREGVYGLAYIARANEASHNRPAGPGGRT